MMPRNPKERLHHIMWRSDLEATRFSLALGSILWAGLLFWPGQLFSPERQTYSVMSAIAPELVWATLFLVQGVAMFYSLVWGYKSSALFLSDAVLGCALWTTSTLACFVAHYQSLSTYQPPAAMSYEVMGALASWWCLVRYSFPQKDVNGAEPL